MYIFLRDLLNNLFDRTMQEKLQNFAQKLYIYTLLKVLVASCWLLVMQTFFAWAVARRWAGGDCSPVVMHPRPEVHVASSHARTLRSRRLE
ncbi:hypothetical protein B5X24_HaOG208615 [Helicoverpa armigera]|nr:hypothetical protein B5X24_HaOG208615 [Helicoverpa armigera]